MSNEIIRISNIARQYKRVDTVMYALNKENLKQSAMKIAGNKAVGIDNVTKREYVENLDENIEDLIVRLKKMGYTPKAVRRVYIPKIFRLEYRKNEFSNNIWRNNNKYRI